MVRSESAGPNGAGEEFGEIRSITNLQVAALAPGGRVDRQAIGDLSNLLADIVKHVVDKKNYVAGWIDHVADIIHHVAD